MSQVLHLRRKSASLLLILSSLCLAGIGAGAGGCQTEPAKASPRGSKPVQLTGFDACSANMHDLAGYLLQYYAINHHLPQTLEELRPLVDADKELPLACPISGKPYTYHPDGLIAAGEQKQLLIVDPEPSHDGQRWAIVTMPAGGQTPLGLWVVLLKETAIQQFHAP